MRLFKTLSLLLIVSLLLAGAISFSACSHEHDDKSKTMKTVKFAPRAKKRFGFNTSEPTTINFNTDLDAKGKKRCKHNGIRMTWIDKNGNGERITSTTDAHIKVTPDDGKVKFTVENLESFPIKVFVSWTAK